MTSFVGQQLTKNHPKTLSELKLGKLTDDVLDDLNDSAASIAGQF